MLDYTMAKIALNLRFLKNRNFFNVSKPTNLAGFSPKYEHYFNVGCYSHLFIFEYVYINYKSVIVRVCILNKYYFKRNGTHCVFSLF